VRECLQLRNINTTVPAYQIAFVPIRIVNAENVNADDIHANDMETGRWYKRRR
jgi:hypothetical protein